MENVLILGSKGMLGGQLMKVFNNAIGWDREQVNVLDFEALRGKIVSSPEPISTIINCVAYNDVDGAEDNPDKAFALNAHFVGNLAGLCAELNIPLVHFSTNYVFDGEKGLYSEDDQPQPISVYGHSKYQGELLLKGSGTSHYLIRTAVLFGPKGESELSKKSFVELMINLSETQQEIKAVNDEINSITLVTDLAAAVHYLVTEHKAYGTYHVVNNGEASWFDMARELFFFLKKDVKLIPVPSSEFPRKARRPKKAVLLNTKMYQLQSWPEALKEFVVREYLAKKQ